MSWCGRLFQEVNFDEHPTLVRIIHEVTEVQKLNISVCVGAGIRHSVREAAG